MTQSPTIIRPTLLLDQRKVLANIRTMVRKAQQAGVRFRPHFKTHQSAEIGDWFRAQGVEAITVSSLEMARYFAEHGWDDITVAFPVNRLECHLINDLAGRIQLNLLVDNQDIVRYLDERVQHQVALWIKVDGGYGRAGIPWDAPEAILGVARRVLLSHKFRFAGLLTHAGHSYEARGAEAIRAVHTETMSRMTDLKAQLSAEGIVGEISVGDTPTASVVADFTDVDELRPGNFVFYDLDQCQIGSCDPKQIGVVLACPVVGKYEGRGEILIYGGAVHFAKQYLIDAQGSKYYGRLVWPTDEGWSDPVEGAQLYALSQEHGKLKVSSELMGRISVGDVLYFLPVHVCLTGNLHRSYLTLEGEPIYRFNSMP